MQHIVMIALFLHALAFTFLCTGCGTEEKSAQPAPATLVGADAEPGTAQEPAQEPTEKAQDPTEKSPSPVAKAPTPVSFPSAEKETPAVELTSPKPIWTDAKTGLRWTLLTETANTGFEVAKAKCASVGAWELPTQDQWDAAMADEIPVGSDAAGWSISAVWVMPGAVAVIQGAHDSSGSVYCVEIKK